MDKKRVTQWVVALTVAVWLVWDVFVYLTVGGVATISTVIGEWLAYTSWAVLAMGLLVGHLMGSVPVGTPGDWWRFGVLAVGVVVGWVLTVA